MLFESKSNTSRYDHKQRHSRTTRITEQDLLDQESEQTDKTLSTLARIAPQISTSN